MNPPDNPDPNPNPDPEGSEDESETMRPSAQMVFVGLIPSFNGEENVTIDSWLEMVDRARNIGKWSSPLTVAIVRSKLRGLAAQYWQDCPEFSQIVKYEDFFPIKLGTIDSFAFMDTGATDSILSPDLAATMKEFDQILEEKEGCLLVQSIFMDTAVLKEKTVFNLTIGSMTAKVLAHVNPTSLPGGVGLIIGNDLMTVFDLNFHQKEGKVTSNTYNINLFARGKYPLRSPLNISLQIKKFSPEEEHRRAVLDAVDLSHLSGPWKIEILFVFEKLGTYPENFGECLMLIYALHFSEL